MGRLFCGFFYAVLLFDHDYPLSGLLDTKEWDEMKKSEVVGEGTMMLQTILPLDYRNTSVGSQQSHHRYTPS